MARAGPIAAITRRELLELWRDRRAAFATFFLAALLLASVATTWLDRAADARARAEAQRAVRAQWEQQKAKNPHSAAHFGTYAFKMPGPLAYLDPGVDPYVGTAVWVEAHRQNQALYRPAQAHAQSLRFGSLTPTLVVQELLPLLLLALAVPAISGPREQGVLRQELATGVRGADLVRGKAVALASVIVAVLAPVAVAGTGLLWMAIPAGGRADVIERWLFWLAVHAGYAAAVLGLGLTISAYARTVRVAWLVAVAVWVSATLLGPRAAGDVAERWYPTPTATDVWAAIQHDMSQGIDGHDPGAARTKALERDVLIRYGVQRLEDLPVNFSGLALQAGEEYGNRVFDRYYGDLWSRYRRQDDVARWLSMMLPVAALRSVSMALAGTDVDAYRRFVTDVEGYRRAMNAQMNDALAYRSAGQTAYLGGAELWKSVPDFAHRPAPLSEVLRAQALNLLIVGTWCGAVVAIAARAAATFRE